MRRIELFAFMLILPLIGAGCFEKDKTYIEAEITPATLEPQKESYEGAMASRGGYEATITSEIDGQILANALPDDDLLIGYLAGIPTETKYPVPDLEGKRTEYSSLTKVYEASLPDRGQSLTITITDTRGLPVLTSFIDSYAVYETDAGYRMMIDGGHENFTAWMTYHRAIGDDVGGFGSITALYRDRFLLQIDGNMGVTETDLKTLLEGVHFDLLQ